MAGKSTTEVRLGAPINVGGYGRRAPIGTPRPTDAKGPLNEAYIDFGGETAAALIRLHNRRQRVGTKAPAKFRNTATGKTWSGRGKKPEWVGGEHSVAV